MSPETRAKISAAKKGKPRSAKHTAAIVEGRRGRLNPGDCVRHFGSKGVVVKAEGFRQGDSGGPGGTYFSVRLRKEGLKLLKESLLTPCPCEDTPIYPTCGNPKCTWAPHQEAEESRVMRETAERVDRDIWHGRSEFPGACLMCSLDAS